MRTKVILVAVVLFCGCGLADEAADPESPGGGLGKADGIAASPFDPGACVGGPKSPGGVQTSYRLEVRRRSCSPEGCDKWSCTGSCDEWEPVTLDVPAGALEGVVEIVEVPYYHTETEYGFTYCCTPHISATGEYTTECGMGYCTYTVSVLDGYHPGVRLTNSLENECRSGWPFWNPPTKPRTESITCSFTANGPSCAETYAYADGCKRRDLLLASWKKLWWTEGAKLVLGGGALTEECVKLVGGVTVDRKDFVEEYQAGLLVTFDR